MNIDENAELQEIWIQIASQRELRSALYVAGHIDRATVPDGFYSYEAAELHQCDYNSLDVLSARTIADEFFSGTVLTHIPFELDELGQLPIYAGPCEDNGGNPLYWTLRKYMAEYFPNEPAPPLHHAPQAHAHPQPDCCYTIWTPTGEPAILRRGHPGYHPYPYFTDFKDETIMILRDLNQVLGVSEQQEQEILAEALAGWSSPAEKIQLHNTTFLTQR